MKLVTESDRLRSLRSYEVLDTPPEPGLDELARAAANVCSVPVGLVSLVDRERQFFKARVGLDLTESPRKGSFCNHAIENDQIFQVRDATVDGRFREHALVVAAPHIRFYAAAPLISPSQAAIGTLCVIDSKPNNLGTHQQEMLRVLGRQVMSILEQRKKEMVRIRVQNALDRELRAHLEAIGRHLGKLHGSAEDLSAALIGADAALQTVEDAIAALSGDRMILDRRPADLAVVCRELVRGFQEDDAAGPFFSATGDCNGFWDLDRITQALAALLERATERPIRVSVNGLQQTVMVRIQAPSFPFDDGSLRVEVALQAIRAHGGEVEASRDRGEVVVAVCLPRTQP